MMNSILTGSLSCLPGKAFGNTYSFKMHVSFRGTPDVQIDHRRRVPRVEWTPDAWH